MKTTFMKTTLMPALAVALFSAGWLARTYAQQKAPAPLITYFSHDSVDASFAQALASTASRDLYSRKDRQGKTWAIHSNSRGKSDEGVLHSHEDWTGVVVIMSGSATFVTPGSPSQTKAAKSTSAEGGQLIGGGESHRVGKGDLCCPVPSVSSRPHSQLEAFFEPIQFHLQSGRSLDKASRLRYLESLDAPSGSSVDPAWHGVSA